MLSPRDIWICRAHMENKNVCEERVRFPWKLVRSGSKDQYHICIAKCVYMCPCMIRGTLKWKCAQKMAVPVICSTSDVQFENWIFRIFISHTEWKRINIKIYVMTYTLDIIISEMERGVVNVLNVSYWSHERCYVTCYRRILIFALMSVSKGMHLL